MYADVWRTIEETNRWIDRRLAINHSKNILIFSKHCTIAFDHVRVSGRDQRPILLADWLRIGPAVLPDPPVDPPPGCELNGTNVRFFEKTKIVLGFPVLSKNKKKTTRKITKITETLHQNHRTFAPRGVGARRFTIEKSLTNWILRIPTTVSVFSSRAHCPA